MDNKIFVAGHKGMVGSAIVRYLELNDNIDIVTRSKSDLNLINQKEVFEFFKDENINKIYLAAAHVGGIYANNTYPADFIYNNLMIASNVINAAFQSNIKKLLFLGSSCIYPRIAKQPMKEESLLTGSLEHTNEPYAIAKIAGIKLCESYNRQYYKSSGIDYRSVMPTNLYGYGDNYHPENSHVIPGLISRFHEAKIKNKSEVIVWGSGKARREFLNVDDLAEACVHVMEVSHDTYTSLTVPNLSHINIGCGKDISIQELAILIAKITSFSGKIIFDKSKPDGSPQKLVDSNKINKLGWSYKIELEDGLKNTYHDYVKKLNKC